MNQVINLNIGGRIITISTEAYDQLKSYLDQLESYFGSEAGGKEILQDMETRISELLSDALKKGKTVIEDSDIAQMKELMGEPEAIYQEAGAEEDTFSADASSEKGRQQEEFSPRSKKLYRSGQDQVIGGVCAGLAEYFEIDPVVVRAIAVVLALISGSGIILYLLLWVLLKKSTQSPHYLKRRLYRNRQEGKLFGVCAGLANYLKVEVTWVRLFFLLPVILSVGFWFIRSHFGFWFTGLSSTSLIIYLLLWLTVPEAESPVEKLEARGERITLQAIKREQEEPLFSKKKHSSFGKVLSALIKAFLIFWGSLFLLVIGVVAFSVLAALFGVGVSSIFLAPLGDVFLTGQKEKILLYLSAACIVISLTVLVVYVIRLWLSKKRLKNKTLTITSMIVFFFLGVFGVAVLGGEVLKHYKTSYADSQDWLLEKTQSDTLTISTLSNGVNHQKKNGILSVEGDIRLDFIKSEDSVVHVTIFREAKGEKMSEAAETAAQIPIELKQSGDTLFFPSRLNLIPYLPFRSQSIEYQIAIPEGRTVYMEKLSSNWKIGKKRDDEGESSFFLSEGNFYYMGASGQLEERLLP